MKCMELNNFGAGLNIYTTPYNVREWRDKREYETERERVLSE